MEELLAQKKLQLIDEALNYFYNTDGDALIARYRNEIQAKADDPAPVMDKETALALLGEIPDKCHQSKSLKIEEGMLKAVSEAELTALCEDQATAHPDIEMEIRSMFKFCLTVKEPVGDDGSGAGP